MDKLDWSRELVPYSVGDVRWFGPRLDNPPNNHPAACDEPVNTYWYFVPGPGIWKLSSSADCREDVLAEGTYEECYRELLRIIDTEVNLARARGCTPCQAVRAILDNTIFAPRDGW